MKPPGPCRCQRRSQTHSLELPPWWVLSRENVTLVTTGLSHSYWTTSVMVSPLATMSPVAWWWTWSSIQNTKKSSATSSPPVTRCLRTEEMPISTAFCSLCDRRHDTVKWTETLKVRSHQYTSYHFSSVFWKGILTPVNVSLGLLTCDWQNNGSAHRGYLLVKIFELRADVNIIKGEVLQIPAPVAQSPVYKKNKTKPTDTEGNLSI